jgi:hypothetical protein
MDAFSTGHRMNTTCAWACVRMYVDVYVCACVCTFGRCVLDYLFVVCVFVGGRILLCP